MAITDPHSELQTILAAIARSPIVVRRLAPQASTQSRLPAGFEPVDAAILEWIAAEGRRASRRYLLI